jgi:hypothetical protein
MADAPQVRLRFESDGVCPDCGIREVSLPRSLPALGDDFDWKARDYDSFRLSMLEELIARFPERSRWTPADLEAVLVEDLAVVLDQLSDMLDRVTAEGFLDSARRPSSVRRLLSLIGYAAAAEAGLTDDPLDIQEPQSAESKLEALWAREPHRMEEARQAGPRAIRSQRRMVTEQDYATRLAEHPLVLRAHAYGQWSGSWITLRAAVINWRNLDLDACLPQSPPALVSEAEGLQNAVDVFHRRLGLPVVCWESCPSLRTVLRPYLDAYRLVGQEVLLEDAEPVGIYIALSVRVAGNFYQSEVRRAVEKAMGTGPQGFFEPGRLSFGQDLHAGDVIQTLTALEGVETVCLNRFKRVGRRYADQSDTGRIVLQGLEIPVCDNDPGRRERGQLVLRLHGGMLG